jgi:hypothetical protein
MPLNTTPAIIQRRAAEELALKLSLEGPVAREFRALFETIAKDFEAVYAATGQIPNASAYTEDSRQILNRLYRAASIEVRRTTRDGIKSQWLDLEIKQALDVDQFDNERIAALIDEALRVFVNRQPVDRSAAIMSTTQDQLEQAVINVMADAAARGVELTQSEVAAAAADELLRLTDPRPQRIAETETLNAVEGTKSIEIATMVAAGASVRGVPLQSATVRQWVTVGDDLVRASHNDADGQLRPVGEAFNVGNSLLRWPGDTGLGAALKEIINCRCAAFVVINEAALAQAA